MKNRADGKKIGPILNSLISSKRFAKEKSVGKAMRGAVLTSLGTSLIEQEDAHFFIDLTGLRFLSGIPWFVNVLANTLFEKCQKTTTDVLAQVAVDPGNTPELASLGLGYVMVYARSSVAHHLVEAREQFSKHLRHIFDALQTPQWGGIIFTSCYGQHSENDEEQRLALHFPLVDESGEPCKYFFFVEYDCHGCFLRITVEDSAESRLYLKRIPHRSVKKSGMLHYMQDIATMVAQIFNGIHRECQNQQTEYTEIPGRQPALFELLINGGLSGLSDVVFRWTGEMSEFLLLNKDPESVPLLAKLFLLLGDKSVIQSLAAGNTVEMRDGRNRVYLDLSRKNSRLNISLGEKRKQPDMMTHLSRMPRLQRAVEDAEPDILQNYRIVLIHHATSEVLGFVKALEDAQASSVTTLFIRYRGIVPDALLDDMLSMPERHFRFYGLQRVELRDNISGAYILSRQYSPISELGTLDNALREQKGNYLSSMRFTAMHLFLREAYLAVQENRKVLVIEDGGYIMPVVNRLCHEKKTLAQVLDAHALDMLPDTPEDILFKDWLKEVMPASFEHTANGYYYLRDVEKKIGGLHFPSFTIALSTYKNVVEAESCAYSIINSFMSIFYGLGKCIMYRHALVLGSCGNIGHFLAKGIAAQVPYGKVYGLDLKAGGSTNNFAEFSHIDEMPASAWQDLDLFLGMTGVSVLQQSFFEKLLLEGRKRELFFASGSTKTIEFESLTNWIGELSQAEDPRIGGRQVAIETRPITDPQCKLLQGHQIRITFSDPENVAGLSPEHKYKDIYMLGDSMPINFLYYGVPGEVIDGVFEELFSLLCGVSRALEKDEKWQPEIFAIDVNIDKHAKRIVS